MIPILKQLWAFWALLAFIITCIIIFPCYYLLFFFNPKSIHFAQQITRFWAWMVTIAFGVRVRVHEKEFIDKNKTYVFVSNHSSQLDIPACMLATPVTFRYLAKAELKKFPVVGYVVGKLYIFVERQRGKGRVESLEAMEKSLKEGISVFIYPEGTRNRGPQLVKEFYDGAFRLAIETKTPLAVLSIVNSDKLLSPNEKFQLSPGIIDCYWEQPIDTAAMTMDDLQKLKEMAKEIMMKHLKNL